MPRPHSWVAGLALAAGCGDPGAPPPAAGPLPQGAPIVAPTPVTAFELGLPDCPWAVRFHWDGEATTASDRVVPAGTARTLIALAGRFVLTVWLRPAQSGDRHAVALRNRRFEELQMQARSPLTDVAQWATGDLACAEFRLATIRGIPVGRLERHCFAVRDGVAVHCAVTVDHAGDEVRPLLDRWTASLALVDRPAPPADELLRFARAAWQADGGAAIARALAHLDALTGRWAALSPPDREALAWLAAEAYPAADRGADGATLVAALLADAPTPALHYAHARLCAAGGRVDAWAASLRAAFAPPGPGADLPDPRDDPAFLAIPDGPFDAALRAVGR